MRKFNNEILTTTRFDIELQLSSDTVDGYFMECRGFKASQKVIEICEVGSGGIPVKTKIAGNTDYTNITLKRGMINTMTLWEWFSNVNNSGWGRYRIPEAYLTIYRLDNTAGAKFVLTNVWPASYKIADVDCTSDQSQIEELELVCESFTRDTRVTYSANAQATMQHLNTSLVALSNQ